MSMKACWQSKYPNARTVRFIALKLAFINNYPIALVLEAVGNCYNPSSAYGSTPLQGLKPVKVVIDENFFMSVILNKINKMLGGL
jgi:hypothetical protein